MERFGVASAQTSLARLRPSLDEIVAVRGELAEFARDASTGAPGAIPRAKGLEARLSELLDTIRAAGVEVKGWAPLLLDWPLDAGEADALAGPDRDVLLCWLENEPELAWWHPADLGFPGRRPLG